MKFAKRMVLVPEEDYLHSVNKQKRTTNVRDRAIEMAQKVGKQMRKRAQADAQVKEVWERLTPPKAADIASLLPALYQPKARLLLAELAKHGVTYTKDNEVVLPDKEVIAGSNMVDLLRAALVTERGRPPRKPKGWSQLIESIAASNIPLSLFSKSSTKRALDRATPRWKVY